MAKDGLFALRLACLALAGLALPGGAGAQDAATQGSIELVDPHVFRACADPRDLPFSNEAGEGFENKIAELFARKLGKSVAYTFYPDATGFIRNTLNAHRCDVVLGIAQGDDIVQPTSPYYRTSYVAAYRAGWSPQGAGFAQRSAPENGEDRHRRGHAAGDPAWPRTDCLARSNPTRWSSTRAMIRRPIEMMDDLDRGEIDVALLWGPIAGYYATKAKTPTAVVPLVKEQGGPRMVYRIVMGVRHSDQNWKRALNKLISENQGEIQAILRSYGVPLLDENDKPIPRPDGSRPRPGPRGKRRSRDARRYGARAFCTARAISPMRCSISVGASQT